MGEMKRKSDGDQDGARTCRPPKRQRKGGKVHLFDLSDELLLRSMSFLSVQDLVGCEQVCVKLRSLSTDNEIWRKAYYNTFVRHRARRLPALQPAGNEEQEKGALHYSSKRARWLEHSHLVGAGTDWKQVYKTKHNWHQGRARKSEVQIDSRLKPVALARACGGKLYTVDLTHGLRVWRKGGILHSCPLTQQSAPTALAVVVEERDTRISVGHENGIVSLFRFDGTTVVPEIDSTQVEGPSVEAIAVSWPYILTLSASRTISLLQRTSEPDSPVRSLATLHSDSLLAPAALSLRKTKTTLIAGICYAFNRFNAGWCLGLQEIRMDLHGTMKKNRTTTSMGTAMSESLHPSKISRFTSRSASTSPFSLHPELMRSPNSLSYCGCYILAGLPDNTLMVYTVSSTDEKLEIGVGRRLWGHTSAISAAEVTSTGKAVSISSTSDEMRYWELEELLVSSSLRKTSTPIKSHALGILSEAITLRGNGIGLALREVKEEDRLHRRCVSFDDEQAIVVGERGGEQILSCFDFA